MESAEDFFRRFLRRKADLESRASEAYVPFYEKYYTNDWAKFHPDFRAQWQFEELVTIDVGDQMARAITIQPYKKMENRRR